MSRRTGITSDGSIFVLSLSRGVVSERSRACDNSFSARRHGCCLSDQRLRRCQTLLVRLDNADAASYLLIGQSLQGRGGESLTQGLFQNGSTILENDLDLLDAHVSGSLVDHHDRNREAA